MTPKRHQDFLFKSFSFSHPEEGSSSKTKLDRKALNAHIYWRYLLRKLQEKNVVDDHGARKTVFIPFEKHEQMMEGIHDLAIIAERRDEEPGSLRELKKRLRTSGGK